jgi:hypothetical protein
MTVSQACGIDAHDPTTFLTACVIWRRNGDMGHNARRKPPAQRPGSWGHQAQWSLVLLQELLLCVSAPEVVLTGLQ